MQLELKLEGGYGVRPDRIPCIRAGRDVPRATFAAMRGIELFDDNRGAEAFNEHDFVEAAGQYETDRMPT
jgi:hypothetical protein